MSDNGRPRPQKLEAELVIRWEVGAHMPHHLLLPKGVTLASILGMLRLAEKFAVDQYDMGSSSSILVPPSSLRP